MKLLPLYRYTLTGRVRGRPNRIGRRLTMQVEELCETADMFATFRSPPPPGTDADEWYRRETDRIANVWKPAGTRWRDATWKDQLEIVVPPTHCKEQKDVS